MALDNARITAALSGLPGWTGDQTAIEVTYQFPNFPTAIAFVQAAAAAAEERRHHPDIDIRYRKVHLLLTTHDEGGTTARDLSLAQALAEAARALDGTSV